MPHAARVSPPSPPALPFTRRCDSSNAAAIDLSASDVLERKHCANNSHIVFVTNALLASSVMRGNLPVSLLQHLRVAQLFDPHSSLCF